MDISYFLDFKMPLTAKRTLDLVMGFHEKNTCIRTGTVNI